MREFGVHPVNLHPGVVWDGCVYGYSGYAKANRELLHRVANTMAVEIRPAFDTALDVQAKTRLEPYMRMKVSNGCPYLRFFGPDRTTIETRPRICFTMMETIKVHREMVDLINENFDELWVPTHWNLATFKASGLKVKSRVMPLGVDSTMYRPMDPRPQLPICTLLSTSRQGLEASPEGFAILTVGVPSHRKGFDILTNAFEKAFAKRKDVHLIVATTHASSNVPELAGLGKYRSNIWALTGSKDESEMAKVYNAVDCYVSASRGEGWNLPAVEAAACGIPVILSDSSTHTEISGGNAWIFKNEGLEKLGGIEKISPWYKGMLFTKLGKKSTDSLAEAMSAIYRGGETVRTVSDKFREKVVTEWSWDTTAAKMAKQLMELQP
jgi:glycosyltransferase involved in cell wall biosynthesis